MEANDMARIYAQVVNGKAKAQSTLLVDDEAGAFWDTVEAEVNAMREANPNIVFDIPGEVPEADDLAGMNPGGEFGQPEAPPEGEGEAAKPPAPPADKPEAPAPKADEDPDAEKDAEDADAEDPDAEPDDEAEPGKPKKGVNPFAKED